MPKRRRAILGGRSNTSRPPKAWTRWHEYAACADVPSHLFYGRESESAAERAAREAAATAVCARCPVRSQCEAHAINLPEPYGVWGGTTEASRRNHRQWARTHAYSEATRAS
ncbi:WhiB family transcriptional regulator [Actinopolymorpha singaporensis]|uniref:Transcriptional regulator WhiB n=1 Tax=Actinopolymorpha singaporensis TaxID=117157 RepID=A0A1H1MVL0_9ACTN|nr:WhiB family transcriptional regulator [Actinopolymorpha singaporensis]SDR90652.1 WhiB family transcriptional regulator, redox-sensing transcriptional regulator [Actinopolymorpha singaporensis]